MSSISLAIPNRIAIAIPVGIAMMIQPNAVVKNSSVKLLDWTINSMYVMSAVRRITIAMIPPSALMISIWVVSFVVIFPYLFLCFVLFNCFLNCCSSFLNCGVSGFVLMFICFVLVCCCLIVRGFG